MAKRKTGGNQTAAATTTPQSSGTELTADVEQRVVAFAEQLGRIVGTVQARAEGWMDREALNKQIASVRDSAAELLDQLKTSVTKAASATKTAAAAAAAATKKARSGGVVDAPGKKHRKPTPKDPRALAADAKASNLRSGKTMMKTVKQRGRG
jgi:phage protein D